MMMFLPDEGDDISMVATKMVDLSIARKDSVSAVCQGIPLITMIRRLGD